MSSTASVPISQDALANRYSNAMPEYMCLALELAHINPRSQGCIMAVPSSSHVVDQRDGAVYAGIDLRMT
jgi:hypothetical protein